MRDRLRCDLVDALRGLKTSPLILMAAVLTLGAAIGMNVAMFGLVDRALLSPPRHIRQPDCLVSLGIRPPGGDDRGGVMTTTSYVAFRTVRDEVQAFSGAAAWQPGPASVGVGIDQVRADTLLVSGNYFEILGVTPRLGRGIVSADEEAAPTSAVLGHAFWMAAYPGDPAVVGRRLNLKGIEFTITGVMPRGFSGHSTASVDVWVPIATAMRANPDWDQDPFRNIVSVVARLADEVTVAAAVQQTGAALQRDVVLSSITGGNVGTSQRRIAFWLTGVALLILVIGLANAATLLLVRGARRRHEAAIRAALGASRGRLLTQVLIHAVLVALAAIATSLVMGHWLDGAVRRVLLPGIAESDGLQPRTLLAAALAGLIAAVVAAGAGTWSLPASPKQRTRAGCEGGPSGLREQHGTGRARLQNGLLIVQTAVCVVLLAGAGMFGRSLYGLLRQDFGMRLDGVLVVEFEQGADAVPDRDLILTNALERVRALPGVRSATIFQTLPFGAHHVPPISIPGRADPPNMGGQLPFLIAATPEFFDILGVDMVAGRPLAAGDDRGEMVVVVNETMARGVWPGEAAVGKCIRIGFDPSFDPFSGTGSPSPPAAVPCRRIVGVARDVRQRSVVPTDNEDRLMQYYVPFSQVPGPPAAVGAGPGVGGILVHAATDPSALIVPLRRLVVDGRSNLPYVRVRSYVELLERQVQPWRLGTTLLALFSGLALAVASMGVYAAFAHAVSQRRREMAIRVAIGASPASVLTMILREAARVATVGIAAGAVAAILAGRSLQSMLFGMVPADPLVIGSSAAAMLLVVVAATLIPARRASRADPTALLRAE